MLNYVAPDEHGAMKSRQEIEAERLKRINANTSFLPQQLVPHEDKQAERLAALNSRIVQRASEQAAKRAALMNQRDGLGDIVRQGERIERVARRLPLAEKLVLVRKSGALARRGEVEQWRKLTADEKLLQTKVMAVEREAGQAALKAQELARRFGLTAEVPCAGIDLQGQCKLLGDAHEAKSLIPSASIQIARLEEERGNLVVQLAETQRQAAGLDDACAKLEMAEEKLRCAKTRAPALALSAARCGELLRAREALASMDRQIQELAAMDSGETGEEQEERFAITHTREQIAAQRVAESQRHRESLNRVDAALATLLAPFDELLVTQAQQAVARLQRELVDAESAFMAAVKPMVRWTPSANGCSWR